MSGIPVFETLMAEGRPLSPWERVIGALTRRLGGTVSLTMEELEAVQDVVICERKGMVAIDAGNFNGGVESVLGGERGDAATEP